MNTAPEPNGYGAYHCAQLTAMLDAFAPPYCNDALLSVRHCGCDDHLAPPLIGILPGMRCRQRQFKAVWNETT